MISYSSNYEDVILQRVFAGLHGGFFVDVGASMPIEASNTWALYFHQKWRGIAIDPLLILLEAQWREHRPEDVLVAGCAGREEGLVPFWTCRASQLSTGANTTLDHWRGYGAKINGDDFTIVSQLTLTGLLDKCSIPEFHLLCIDVEGMEGEVLAGLDLHRYRPWLMVIECMLPATTTECLPWEAHLIGYGYRRVYEDRANTWYLADEHPELLHHFRYGPNYTDFIVMHREAKIDYELKKLKGELK
jgi:FkbM family methyltransferase